MPSENYAHDVILSYHGVPVLRVSTASWEWFGEDPSRVRQMETWIFSDLKDFRSRQRTWSIWEVDRALKFHARITRILKRKFAYLEGS